jgi:hypothetical protein
MRTKAERPPPVTYEKQVEVLGRVLLALREYHLCDLMSWHDYWLALGGGCVLEWWEGPYATELYELLIERLDDSENRLLRPSDFVERTDIHSGDREHRIFLLVRDVPVEFRSCWPIGLAAADARSRERLRQIVSPDE